MINKNDLKIILISFVLIFSVQFIFVAIETALQFLGITLAAPLFFYVLYGYSPLAFTGLYIGWTKTSSKTKVCLLASLFYILKRFCFGGFETDSRHNFSEYNFMIVLNLTALSFLIILGANTLSQQIKKIKNT
ncbi:hypothetical protein [Desulfosudis oleivorans]|uniref:Uncharacterized protein n=1 Tax=Desulfosudis oleivorans (strain DSM 6200 / JCM 39069 / Hxd3) TaxID=96561 RepID=A9A081_DESOH|nr:hypothetical protein [Desulfosudis oleivorans]ABW69000.1 hypothetical protein Dole_3197 [Desulfosudis oleivorans Hxd3]